MCIRERLTYDIVFKEKYVPHICLDGQMVSKENPVIFIEAMKMEYQLVAPKSGKVSGLKNKKGDLIEKGQTLLEIE